MAVAENLKATRGVDIRVKGVVDKVLDVGDVVRGVDARVANGVKAVIDGAQTAISLLPKIDESLRTRWKRDEGSCTTNSQ